MKPVLISLALTACTAESISGVDTSELNLYADLTRSPSGDVDVLVELGTYDAALDKNYVYLEAGDRLTAVSDDDSRDLDQHGPVLGVVQYKTTLDAAAGSNVEIELERASTGELLISEGRFPELLSITAPTTISRDASFAVDWTGGDGAEDVEVAASSSCARIETTRAQLRDGGLLVARDKIVVTEGAPLPCQLTLRATAVARGTTDPRLDDWWLASGFYARQVTEQQLTITE